MDGSTRNTDKLSGRVALITGGPSGIGKATALLSIREGATIIIPDDSRPWGKPW